MNNPEYIQAWLEKADHDLGTAKLIYLHIPAYYDTIAFHCQQAVEKYLKGYLIFLDIGFKPVHDLRYLLNLVLTIDQSFDPLYERLSDLNDFAVKIRYPDLAIMPTNSELEEAIHLAQNVKELVENKLSVIN
jgi:HEPN domain-containing protein